MVRARYKNDRYAPMSNSPEILRNSRRESSSDNMSIIDNNIYPIVSFAKYYYEIYIIVKKTYGREFYAICISSRGILKF